jgi:hypothetical protein
MNCKAYYNIFYFLNNTCIIGDIANLLKQSVMEDIRECVLGITNAVQNRINSSMFFVQHMGKSLDRFGKETTKLILTTILTSNKKTLLDVTDDNEDTVLHQIVDIVEDIVIAKTMIGLITEMLSEKDMRNLVVKRNRNKASALLQAVANCLWYPSQTRTELTLMFIRTFTLLAGPKAKQILYAKDCNRSTVFHYARDYENRTDDNSVITALISEAEEHPMSHP